eukprot:gene10265-11319_t
MAVIFKLKFWLVRGNFSVAKQYLRDSYNSSLQSEAKETGVTADWYHLYARVHCDKLLTTNSASAVASLVTVLEKLDEVKKFAVIDDKRSISHHILESNTWNCLADVVTKQDGDTVGYLFGGKQLNCLSKIYGIQPPSDKKKCRRFLEKYSFSCLQSAVAKSHQLDENIAKNRLLVENALMTMTKFCDKSLRQLEEDDEEIPEKSEYADLIVRHLLKAMTLGSTEARQRFPLLLQIISRYPETRDAFCRKTGSVPLWMFLSWLNQIVALLDKDEAPAVLPLLKKVAKEYPQALVHPLRISSEQYSFGSHVDGRKNRDNFERLFADTNCPVWDEFVAALDTLTNPDHIFKDWFDDMKKLLEVKRRDRAAIAASYRCIWKKLFQLPTSHEIIRGKIRQKCAKKLNKVAETEFGKDGGEIPDMTSNEFSSSCVKILKSLKAITFEHGHVDNYSPWFSAFHSKAMNYEMEIPGQYTGKQKPLVEYHVHIVGFDQTVLVMRSIRCPKRLKIRGGDEKEYKFLVKGGEDLRLDQRIQQLFDIMNGILIGNAVCSTKTLALKTYQVIPLTSRIGIIEWLDNTEPLKALLDCNAENESAGKHYQDFLRKYTKPCDARRPETYYNLYKLADRIDTVIPFEQRQQKLPWDLLRRALDKMATSSEAYFVLRNHFIHTHSSLSACQYILGIGDRHLDNFLLDRGTGGVIGIDFGCSFGFATTHLPIPELVPFRLTRQFVNLLLPLKNSGLYRLGIAAVLAALRKNPELLLNTMDVFINEPLVDWQANARKQIGKMDNTDGSGVWYPKEKIAICKLKLNGINCAYITGEEIRLGHEKRSVCKEMRNVAHGDSKYNIRKRFLDEAKERNVAYSKYCLTPEQQALCLIDQATDSNILGRFFVGWAPWI